MPLSNTEIAQAIARVRRAMPRNVDVMAVCDAAEAAITQAATQPTREGGPTNDPNQRDLMRRRRAKERPAE
jgi:hypothetical protein